jgi:diguanylate cyclase (GGDEF)-like protein
MKADTFSRRLSQEPAGVIAAVSSLGVVAYSVGVLNGSINAQIVQPVTSLALILVNLIVCAFGVYILLQKGFGRILRWAWFMLTLGALSFAIAESIWFFFEAILQVDPFAGPAGIFYTAYYPLTLIGLLIFPFVFVSRQERSVLWLDLAIVMVFFGMALGYYFLATPIFVDGQGIGKGWVIVSLVGDLLILAAIIALIQRDLIPIARKLLGLMALAILFKVLADFVFVYNELAQIPYQMYSLKMLWLFSAQVQMWAAASLIISGPKTLDEPAVQFSPFRHLFRLALPYLAIIIGLALLASAISSKANIDMWLISLLVGAYGLIGLVLMRQYIVSKENVRLYQKMRRIAWTDSLTGLYNRHFFNEMLPRELERTNRYSHQLSVLLMDINGFKKYNDTYGHLQGDVVLKTVARLFSSQLRASDTIARFGGDEFVVILPETNRRKAQTISKRIGEAMTAQSFGEIGLNVSIGVSSFRTGLTPEQLLDEADKDMYRRKNRAKKNGQSPVEKSPLSSPGGNGKEGARDLKIDELTPQEIILTEGDLEWTLSGKARNLPFID